MLRYLALFCLLCLAPLVRAQTGPSLTEFTLDNGLQAIVIEDHRQPVVTHMLWYRAGSADETPGKSGIAHFLEHLMFKATDKIAAGEFSKIVAENGGQDNAFTSYDYTGYYQRIAADRLEIVMKMEADRMTGLHLSDAEVAPELQVVLEERSQRVENNPGALFAEQRRAALFLNHPYGRPIIGWPQEVTALTRTDAETWYRQHYAPNNAVLIIAGDVTPNHARALAEKYYGPIPANPDIAPRQRVTEPPHLAERRLSFTDPRVGQPYVIRTYLVPERNPGDQDQAAALTILAELLGSGITSVLQQKLKIEQKIAVSTGTFYDGLSLDTGQFGVYVMPRKEIDLERAEAALDAVLADFLQTGPDPNHLARIKKQMRANQIYQMDNQFAQANQYGEALMVSLTLDDIADWPDRLLAVSAEDVMEAARLLDRKHAVTGFLRGDEK